MVCLFGAVALPVLPAPHLVTDPAVSAPIGTYVGILRIVLMATRTVGLSSVIVGAVPNSIQAIL